MNIRGADFVYYQSNDMEKAIEFYRDTLGIEMYGYYEEVKWAEFNAGNVTLAINDPSAFDPSAKAQTGGAAISLAVEDVEETMKELEAKGVTVTVPSNESPVCHFACISDPDGNTIWLHHRKDGSFAD
ncbi:MAG: glyoxalase/bleomycin resistance/dioxygenase family protein [Gemmatimonadetes bacterium]|jgi:predicted enzyme related to lactoylglutathione lyase|nr:glyoxalase/bleomycin resistance/dioxygenase family protein [Gemmatimonadota bacterium]MBT4609505.1 glyoxalase/bleomycin resistance/dioxygenase family protein [Gemmatimonadota bacterium]MBT5056240.1 glyoxalase/bleomycin resistance/dioxygenase family protein [Gemmatimonadota bacterium]MBT5144939.1 glyoxalase/bleomycin resistance/dioxygenase family protein [Gemmatimonadota bacterium]MBT5587311.1 glyoxalase/bleomycin resistance/dioxygenase family protein [Gemmatimonadota bacterium]